MHVYYYQTSESDKLYVGQTMMSSLDRYRQTDISRARKGDSRKPHLYNAMRVYGPETFTIHSLAVIHCDDKKLAKSCLDRIEQFYIALYQTQDKEKGYNIAAGGSGSFGYKKVISEETRRKMAEANRGRKHSPETRAKISAGNKGRKRSAEQRQRISAAKMGKKTGPFTEEHRRNMGLARLGKKASPEKCEKQRQSMLKLRETVPQVFHKMGGTSKFKGVSKKTKNRWKASLRFKGRDILLGSFITELGAALAYDDAARTYLGEFALLNFPKEGEKSALKGEDPLVLTSVGRESEQSSNGDRLQ
jgi:group I intron endonuclease